MLPVNCGSHSDYQNFVVKNLRKYYPNPDSIARSTWDIIDRFWNLDLSYTDEFMRDKYSKFGPAPRTPSCMQRSYLLSIDFKVTSLTDWAAQLKINPVRGPGRFCRSVKESLNGPVQANRSDDTKSGIGTERKNIPGFRINMYINTFSFNPEITGKSGHSNGIRITFLLPLIHMNLRSIPFIFRTMRHSRISYPSGRSFS